MLGSDLRMFGQSLSSGVDVDDNGYQGNTAPRACWVRIPVRLWIGARACVRPCTLTDIVARVVADVAVGAFLSDAAVVLR